MAAASTGHGDMRWDVMEAWEFDFLCTGIEPDEQYAPLFALLYELGDWRPRWEQVRGQIVRGWRCMPLKQRPLLWISYLAEIGYISQSLVAELREPKVI